jgi:hypothetical protein
MTVNGAGEGYEINADDQPDTPAVHLHNPD